MLQTGQQPKHLAPLQTEQLAGVRNTQTARLNAQQDLEPVEFLLAHRHHRHRAPPRLLEPRPMSRQLCRGVSSLYCGYMSKSYKAHYDKLLKSSESIYLIIKVFTTGDDLQIRRADGEGWSIARVGRLRPA